MARLNDPPLTAPDPTALDVLKRRFTRQNRDLARTNSAQSLRIRNLETEITRLLSENITLREAVIASEKEAERWRLQSNLGTQVLAMKEKLDSKLQEVNDLVLELGALPEKAGRRKSKGQKRRETMGLPKQQVSSPDQKDWRNRQTLTGVLGGGMAGLEPEGRLPPIVEDKLYPRKTLEPLEIQGLQATQAINDSESPEIGPPPISTFDAVDRGSWGDMDESPKSQEATILESDVMQLPSNLETRRKRRTSSLLSDMTPSESESDAQESKPALFKSGAKRKLDISELEELPPLAKDNDDFVFHRRPALKPVGGRKSGRFSRSTGQQQGEIIIPTTQPSPQKEQPTERKVLAAKSTNSPSKRAASIDGKDLKPDIKNLERNRVSVVRNISGITQPSRPRRQQELEPPHESKAKPNALETTSTNDLPPKTPASLDDMLSPISTEPSTKNEGKRAPQEAAMINSVEDVLNGSIGRASRRAKAAVSYAEPNLRDKMRRPGKELVSAVEGIDRKGSRGASVCGMDFSRSQSEQINSEAPVEMEVRETDVSDLPRRDKWKKLPIAEVRVKKEEPTSPLSDKKKADVDEPRETVKKHERKKSIINGVVGIERLEQDVGRLSIFDPPSSSPAEPQKQQQLQQHQHQHQHQRPIKDTVVPSTAALTSKRRPQSTTTTNTSTAPSRRHSLAPSNISSTSNVLGAKSTNALSVQAQVQRPSSAASNRSDGLEGKRHGVELKRATSVAALKHVAVAAGVENGDDNDNDAVAAAAAARARADRMASRRRSMMI